MKRKIIISFSLILMLGVIWVIEPLSFNPFVKVQFPEIDSKIEISHNKQHITTNHHLENRANKTIKDYMISNSFLGVATGFYIKDSLTYTSGAGFTNKANNTSTNSSMLGRIASITKPMTAIAIMQLYEKGLIDLDVPIQTYLKEFPKKVKGEITIRHLLKHTSGISHYSSKWDAMSFTHYSSLVDALNAFKDRELEFKPGTQYLYTSYGYTILGAIIEKITETSFGDYMKENIWDKADMRNTTLEDSKLEYLNKSKLYIKVKSTFIKSPKTDLSVIYSAGGVQSTVGDLIKFGDAVLKSKLIKKSTLEKMISATDEKAPEKGEDPYGFGWAVYDDPKYGKIIQHGGAQPGASTFFSIYLDYNAVIAVLSNSFGSRRNAFLLSRDMANLILQK